MASENKKIKVAKRLIKMFQIKKNEVVAITEDTNSEPGLVDALFAEVVNAGGKPLVLKFKQARDNGQAGFIDWPAKALTAALSTVDVWIETNYAFLLYSNIWETAMATNKKLRFLTITQSSTESLERVFCNYEVADMSTLLYGLKEMASTAKKVKIKAANGTNVSFDLEPNFPLDLDDGDFSKPKFMTAPGYLNIVPKTGTMHGTIVFDMIMHADLSDNSTVKFTMKDGKIIDFRGSKGHLLKNYVDKFNEENMFKISHMMIGANPGVRELSYEIVEDERIWGGVDFGFGHTSPIDMPPLGQKATSHFDGVVEKVDLYFDDIQVIEKGVFSHHKIKGAAKKLLN
jgi:leucyl aminopeptidase (aminopeptidase T)